MTDHYEALFDSTYLRWFDLNESPALIEIVGVEKKELTLPGGVKKRGPVMQFKQVQGKIGTVKPLVLNRTNADTIAEIHGKFAKQWAGKEVVLFQTTTNLKGKETNCIRIRARKG